MASQLHKGDIVRCIAGEFAGHFAKVKKIDRHLMVHLDLDKSEKKNQPINRPSHHTKNTIRLREFGARKVN